MKIQAIAALCKKRKKISSFQVGETQFVGTGTAYYSLGDIPYMDANALCELFGLKDSERESWEIDLFTRNMFFERKGDAEEKEASEMALGLSHLGKDYAALLDEDGIQYIDTEYLKPVSDCKDLKFVVRRSDAIHCILVLEKGTGGTKDTLLAYLMPNDINSRICLAALNRMAIEMETQLIGQENE